MNENTEKRLLKSANTFLIILSAGYFLLYLFSAAFRIGYPFELEWMEGGSVDHVARILAGLSIYTKPSLDFIPYIYTPLYYYLSALVAVFTGIGFFPLRLVSFLSSLVTIYYVYLIVTRETYNKLAGIIAGGIFSASFFVSGSWYDLARVDSLFMMFFIISVYLLRFKKNPAFYFLAGIMASLSFLTKQSALSLVVPFMIFLFFENRKLSWYFNITFIAIVVSSSIIFNAMTDGWYYFWNFSLVSQHDWNKKYFILFWTLDIFRPFSIGLVVTIFYFILKKTTGEFRNSLFYLILFIATILCSWPSRLHYGGYLNVLIPLYTGFAIFLGLGYHSISSYIDRMSNESKNLLKIFLSLIIISQFLTLWYNPLTIIPTKKDKEAGKYFVERISKIKGDVFVFSHSYVSRYAGKFSYPHEVLIMDLCRTNREMWKPFEQELTNAVKNHRFAAIVTDANDLWEMPELNNNYYKAETLFTDPKVFFSKSGYIARPDYIYFPKEKK